MLNAPEWQGHNRLELPLKMANKNFVKKHDVAGL